MPLDRLLWYGIFINWHPWLVPRTAFWFRIAILLYVHVSVTDVAGSGSYQKAIEDVKRLFPDGLCCNETSTMRQEQVHV